MARRTFRYDPVSKSFVEVTRGAVSEAPAIRDDIAPFVSPIDGSVINSQSALREHMGKHGVVHTHEVAGHKVEDRYQKTRERVQMREMMWEYTDRAIRTGKARG
jgi:hypothetical protein